MKHTNDSEKNEGELDIDQLLANVDSRAELDHEVDIIAPGGTPADTPATLASRADYRQASTEIHAQVDPLARHQVAGAEVPGVPGATVPRRRRAKRRSRNHVLVEELKMLQGEPYAEFVVITATAIESGMRCDRWRSDFQLMDELNVLIDVGLGDADIDDSAHAERVELAGREHEKCPSIKHWGETIDLRHHHDVQDAELGISLRLHFAKEAHSCRVILGWIEEVALGEPHAHNEVAMSAAIES